MGEAPNIYPNLNDQFRLNKINEIKDCFIAEIKERQLMRKGLSKYIISFAYFVLSTASGGICIELFATVVGAPAGIVSASLSYWYF